MKEKYSEIFKKKKKKKKKKKREKTKAGTLLLYIVLETQWMKYKIMSGISIILKGLRFESVILPKVNGKVWNLSHLKSDMMFWHFGWYRIKNKNKNKTKNKETKDMDN